MYTVLGKRVPIIPKFKATILASIDTPELIKQGRVCTLTDETLRDIEVDSTQQGIFVDGSDLNDWLDTITPKVCNPKTIRRILKTFIVSGIYAQERLSKGELNEN